MSAVRDLVVGRPRRATVSEGPALWRGEIVEVLSTGLVWVMIPRMGGTDPLGPISTMVGQLVPGERVVVGAVGGDVNDLIVMSRVTAQPMTPPAWDDITGKPATFPPAAHTHQDATIAVSGFMPASDKARLDSASPDYSVNSLMLRDANGWARANNYFVPAGQAQHANANSLTNKDYVDAQVAGRAPLSHRHTYAEIDGVVPTSALPPLAVIDTFTVASQAEMLTLTAQRGDMAIRTDTPLTFVLAADDPTKLVNWKTIQAAGQVTSVNGKTGTVQLVKADIGLGNLDNTADAEKPVSTATATALTGKANVIHTHDITAIIGWRGNWIDVPITDNRFEAYSAGTMGIRLKKELGRVYATGALRVLADNVMGSGSMVNVGTLPHGYETGVYESPVFVCQGSSSNRYVLQISSGTIQVGRYGPGAQLTNAWLPFSVSWDAATP